MDLIKYILLLILAGIIIPTYAQTGKIQQGLILKAGGDIRLGSIPVIDKRSGARTKSNTTGVFSIAALPGDTLEFNSDGFENSNFVVSDFSDKIIYLTAITQLPEVQVKEYSLKYNLEEAKAGYRRKSVFYTGTPHYYYLFLKPMTFIYENFKSEVIEARRFNKYAHRELVSYKIAERYNDSLIKKYAPELPNNQIDDFKWQYMPTLARLNQMSDYDIILYIKKNYAAYKDSIRSKP